MVFCSRTHSQLAQVVGELRRTPFGSSLRVALVAGRGQLCVHEPVRALSFANSRMAEKCRDLATAAKAKRGSTAAAAAAPGRGGAAVGAARAKAAPAVGCPFKAGRSADIAALRELILSEPMDVEELAAAGRGGCACPYYAARSALPSAQLVLLPYASLLAKDTRAALGLQLEGKFFGGFP